MKLDKSLFNDLKNIKDNVLVVFLLNYAIGYLSFCIYSYKNSLGVISAFDLQYLLAGLIPSLFAIGCFFIFFKVGGVVNKCQTYLLNPTNRILAKIVTLSLWLLTFLYFGYGMIKIFLNHYDKGNYDKFDPTQNPLSILLIALFISFYPFEPLPEHMRSKFDEKTFTVLAKFIYVTLISVGLIFYYRNYYIKIPQELGGVRPKKAILYSDSDIFDKPIKANNFYLDTVFVYYYNTSSFIYKKSTKNSKSVEVNRTKLFKVVWLD